MADFISCGNDLDFQTIIMSLFAVETDLAGQPTMAGRIRIVTATIDTSEDPIACAVHPTLLDMFRQCIALADDGFPALRVVNSDYANGNGITSAWGCAHGNSMDDNLRKIFCVTTDSEMAIRLANIT